MPSNIIETCDRLGIKKATLYTWFKATGLQPTKGKDGRSYCSEEQIMTLESFATFLQQGGRMHEWKEAQAEDENLDIEQQFQDAENLEIETVVTSIEQQEEEESLAIEQQFQVIEASPVIEENSINQQILDNAQRQAAGILLAQNLLAGQFLENPDSLSEEYKEMVQRATPVPKAIDPLVYAKQLIQKLALV